MIVPYGPGAPGRIMAATRDRSSSVEETHYEMGNPGSD
jgi:hypothetical protein